MMRRGRILVVDDLERWRKLLPKVLGPHGFQVDIASTILEAKDRLRESFYHALVLDIRMDDPDQENVEGMSLLEWLWEQGISDATAIIMLSAYGTKEQMRAAFRRHKVADFIDKSSFDNQEFVQRMRQIFVDEVRINFGLPILWQEISGPTEAVVNLEIGDERIKRSSPLQARVAAELDDLLCRIFHTAESILIRPLMAGASGASVLWVQPFYVAGAGHPVVVKFGDYRKVDQEHKNFKKYVQPFISGGRNTTVLDLRRTPLLGGIVYSLLGAASDRLEDFGCFYRKADISQIRLVLNRLFHDTCGTWYASPGKLQPHNLTDDYKEQLGFTKDGLERALNERLKNSVQGRTRLQFRSLPDDRRFSNPILALDGPALLRTTYICPTHGDLNESNILIDEARQAWLIDFFRTRPGHFLRDVAELDSAVRIKLLQPEDAPLEVRLRMEETLLKCHRFSDVGQLATDFPTENRELAKAYHTVVYLRGLAQKLAESNRADDISEYYIALFYYALNMTRFAALPTIQREHALLSASLLVDRLGL